MSLTIKTNNVPREMLMLFQLDEKDQKIVRKNYDYFTEEELNEQRFFDYKGFWYCLSDFLRLENSEDLKGWDGYYSDSYFSGVLVKLVQEESVIVGRYYS